MHISLIINDRSRIDSIFPFMEILIKNKIIILLITKFQKRNLSFFNLRNISDLENLKKFIKKDKIKKHKNILPRINTKNSYNISLKRLLLHFFHYYQSLIYILNNIITKNLIIFILN